jgi:hypothetical protein
VSNFCRVLPQNGFVIQYDLKDANDCLKEGKICFWISSICLKVLYNVD